MKRLLSLMVAAAAPAVLTASPAAAQLSINISVNFAPPALPVYDQPPIPAPDYIWVPGYWAWDDFVQGYFWVPGTWMLAPRRGLLWTPPWWGWQGGAYLFHPGYWAPHVGFYGGVVYGFGYTGSGFEGAFWNGPHVSYNRAVTNIRNVNVTNVYNKTVIINRTTNVSYNGGPGGVQARPSQSDIAAMHEPRVAPPQIQQQHVQAARADRQLFATANHGRPPIAAAPMAARFDGPGIVAARQAPPYHAPGNANAPKLPPNGPESRRIASPAMVPEANAQTVHPAPDARPENAGARAPEDGQDPRAGQPDRDRGDAVPAESRMRGPGGAPPPDGWDRPPVHRPPQVRAAAEAPPPRPAAPKTPPPAPHYATPVNPPHPRPSAPPRPKPAPHPAPHKDDHNDR